MSLVKLKNVSAFESAVKCHIKLFCRISWSLIGWVLNRKCGMCRGFNWIYPHLW